MTNDRTTSSAETHHWGRVRFLASVVAPVAVTIAIAIALLAAAVAISPSLPRTNDLTTDFVTRADTSGFIAGAVVVAVLGHRFGAVRRAVNHVISGLTWTALAPLSPLRVFILLAGWPALFSASVIAFGESNRLLPILTAGLVVGAAHLLALRRLGDA